MRVFLLTVLFFTTTAWAQSDIEQALAPHEHVEGLTKRLDQISRSYLNFPYLLGQLGEGAEGRYDQDPLWRFDGFDCTTFVETVTSLALSRSAQEFQDHMREIRYQDGIIDYVQRNHFPSLQWIPNNVANGYLDDITHDLVSAKIIEKARAVINLPRHYQMKKLEELRVFDIPREALPERLLEWQAEGEKLTATEATLDYIPIDWLVKNPAVLRKIPHGSIVNFVRPNWDLTQYIGTHMNVSHQGFIFQHSGKTWLRHASSGNNKVHEESFADYLKRFEGHATMKGVHFMSVKER